MEWLIREGTFLGWGILVFFSKKALALPCVLIEKTPDPLPPPPHLKMTDKSATLPSLLHGMFHVVETSEHFACER